jgi:hypothetical protein
VVELHINSCGGSAFEGLGIASVLRDYPAKIEAIVDGVAASAATLPLMVSDRVTIPANGLLMIHEPYATVTGRGKELTAAAAMLDGVTTAGASLYSAKSGKTDAEVRALMAAETWYTGDQAVSAGFADTTGPALPASKVPDKAAQQRLIAAMLASPAMAISSSFLPAPKTQMTTIPPVTGYATKTGLHPDIDRIVHEAVHTPTSQLTTGPLPLVAISQSRLHTLYAEMQPRLGGMTQEQFVAFARAEEARLGITETVATTVSPSLAGDAKYRQEYAANKHLQALMSVEEHISGRRIDDGVVALRPGDQPLVDKQRADMQFAVDEANRRDQAERTADARFASEYRSNPHFRLRGTPLSEYIATRRVDEGLDQLRPDAEAAIPR